MADVAILVPVLGRPHHIEPLLDTIYLTVDDPEILFLTTESDTEPRKVIKKLDHQYLDVEHRPRGDYARKINAGYRNTKSELIFLGATDLHFHPHWFENATAKIDDEYKVVGTNDLGNENVLNGKHATHSLVTRAYVDDFGTIDEKGKVLHEGYEHEYVDNEFVETAKFRRKWAMARDSVVEHMHPAWGKGDWDDSYNQVNVRWKQGYWLYRKRNKKWSNQRRPR